MIGRTRKLTVSQQCSLLGLARSTACYTPREVSAEDLALMRRIDELHLEHPFAGARMLRDLAVERPNQVWAAETSPAFRCAGASSTCSP